MGRKIPGKKHHGTKDPEKQRAVRLKSIKHKINAPPTNPDEQSIPKSLQRIIDLKAKVKSGEISLKYRSKKKRPTLPKPIKPVVAATVKRLGKPKEHTPNFTQYDGETNRAFLFRVNQVVKTVLKESEFENKYGVYVKRNQENGEVEGVVKREKDEIDDLMKRAKNLKKKKKKSKTKETDEPKLTKSQKKQKKVQEKKERKAMAKPVDFDSFKDVVQFGDIVHEPPSLIAPKKATKNNGAPRPGGRDLLLKNVLEETERKPNVQFPLSSKKTVFQKIAGDGKFDKTGKRKELPLLMRKHLESQQSEVVKAYRLLKAKKTKLTI